MTSPVAITNYHRALLGKVRADLQSGVIPPHRFDMRNFDFPSSCGTIHCIGGWMRQYAAEAGGEWDEEWTQIDGPFTSLFFPKDGAWPWTDADYAAITPQQAIVAIDLWLSTGWVDWRAIMESVK